ncbi:MAG: N-acetylneuraminate synthase [Solirubrobacteraceae bacterium]
MTVTTAQPRAVDLGGRAVGPGHPVLVIAEAGVNHNGELALALKLVEAAAGAGADAVKFQTFRAESVISRTAPKAPYQIHGQSLDAETQLQMVKALELPDHAFRVIAEHCRALGILFLSTPFDEQSADFLVALDVAAIKVGSGELTNLRFLEHLATLGRPMIVSTGMATLEEVRAAVAAIDAHGAPPAVLLHCVSSYPAAVEDCNLRAIATMERAFGVPIGYSDHTPGTSAAIAAVALGACVVEKHLTLDRAMPGPDHQASLEPLDFATLCRELRAVQAGLGDGIKRPVASEGDVAAVARRSLVAARDLRAGRQLDASDIAVKRPGTGLPPGALRSVVGRRLLVDASADELLLPAMLA